MRDEPPMSLWRALTTMFRVPRRGRGFWYSFAIDVLWPLMALSARLRFRGTLPPGPLLLASNHLSYADPVTVTAFALSRGRIPRYLARADLWTIPVIGKVVSGGGHIAVERNTARARDAFAGAVDAVRRGECVAFFPEAGFSDNQDFWPSEKVKNGIARVALETGAPVVPVVNWGTHLMLPEEARFPRLFPRVTVDIVAAEPVDLSDLVPADPEQIDRALLDEATKRIMHAITTLLADLRDEQPPQR